MANKFENNRTPKEKPKRRSLLMRTTMYSKIQCPNCKRNFAKKAAARHIPICKNIIHKPKRLRRSSGYSVDHK